MAEKGERKLLTFLSIYGGVLAIFVIIYIFFIQWFISEELKYFIWMIISPFVLILYVLIIPLFSKYVKGKDKKVAIILFSIVGIILINLSSLYIIYSAPITYSQSQFTDMYFKCFFLIVGIISLIMVFGLLGAFNWLSKK